MPIYEYACEKCQHVFEELVYGGETIACPKCHTAKIKRLISVPGRPIADASHADVPMNCRGDGPACGHCPRVR